MSFISKHMSQANTIKHFGKSILFKSSNHVLNSSCRGLNTSQLILLRNISNSRKSFLCSIGCNSLYNSNDPFRRWNSTTSTGAEILPGDSLNLSYNVNNEGFLPLNSLSLNTEASEPVKSGLESFPDGYIPAPPEAPVIPEGFLEPSTIIHELNALGEPTFASLGLANYTPPGLIQKMLEMAHVYGDLPWWGAIMAATLILRMCVFPLVVYSQKNTANMSNHMPTVQRLQARFTEARAEGNFIEAARTGNELSNYMSLNNVKPIRNLIMPLAQMPIFISVFVGVRKMAALPVHSMATGGMLWFVDLTVPDPFYLLPILTSTTFLATVELGVDGQKAASMGNVKWLMRILPIVMFPFIVNFPSAMLLYWFTSNTFSMMQVALFKVPGVKAKLGIPEVVIPVKMRNEKDKPKKNFVQGFKDTWKNSKVIASLEDRQRVNAVKFKESGQKPMVKTYSYDPTKAKK